ncbi:REDUCED CHLOROPLAST COVERAGE 1-like protein [Drosera capensis]
MAPKGSKGKAKGDKKKKEEKILPVVLDVTVNLPDESIVILKGISTDKVIDIRKLLAVNTETCNLTNFSLSHEVRGPQLTDTVDVAALKPCTLTLVEENYDDVTAVAHVRRLLDIVACTTSFGPSAKADDVKQAQDSGGPGAVAGGSSKKPGKGAAGKKSSAEAAAEESGGSAKGAAAKDDGLDGEGEMMNNACPKLGGFYEFFSLAHLTPPLQFIRRVLKPQDDLILADDHLFFFNVKLCNGKLVLVEACRRGFFSFGKHKILSHNLVGLLSQLSRAFDKAYGDLMKAFVERNKFGNLPYGFRANTWLISPAAAQSPATFPPLPVEDEIWGGHGGGWGRDGRSDLIPWANEFQLVAAMPCKTAEDRQIRDRKAFLVRSLFVDVAIFRAVSTLENLMKKSSLSNSDVYDEILHTERVGDLYITVMRDARHANCKVDTKIDGLRATGLEQKALVERNILKGITADENTAPHDIGSLGSINVRYAGYIATVKIDRKESLDMCFPSTRMEVFDQPEGGANALNINSLRLLLHKRASTEPQKSAMLLQVSDDKKHTAAKAFVEKILGESLLKLQDEKLGKDDFIRWELGACWIQHLQDQKNNEKEKKSSLEKTKSETKIQGLGSPLRFLKSKKAEGIAPLQSESFSSQGDANSAASLLETDSNEDELPLRQMLSEAAFVRLKESQTRLHQKELIDLSQKYYDEVALPKLVADFGSLELSPVDGRTLTDFMHTRGLRMRSLGRVVKLSEKLPHVQSLCIHEMIIRAYKHIIQAVIASVDRDNMAFTLVSALNLMLGPPETGSPPQTCTIHQVVQRWLEVFLFKRYDWDMTGFDYNDLRKFVILRGLCHKVGIELVPRDYDMTSPDPFHAADLVSLIPVYKQAACSSADGQQLLESSKTALDKGKLDDAVNYGTKALAKLIAVCGPYHRMTAGAYSLLAVVLYHTGDFNQATIYQQKALDINERELGLDHPDTMKSYGDLAVFYYRLQHTELALKYVKRALYLLHLTCGPSHPNTAATYINIAMMEEGLGNVHIALRYLHKALKCNERLLGPDHIQTAASYHAIAIALSLMEAYPLSVQHEQTTLRILRAKLGPDDLRTQDAAAWLEYFESKVIEQQEAVRNGTRKPDASIASKGHLSVSDLLDYINPTHDSGRRNLSAMKRKTHVMKDVEKLGQDSSKDTPEESPRDSPLLDFSQEKPNNENETLTDEASSEGSSSGHPEEPVVEAAEAKGIEKEVVDSDEVFTGMHAKGEDEWQPVQRPRAAGACGRRYKQPSLSMSKAYGYEKKERVAETEHDRPSNSNHSSRYYLVKKRTLPRGSHTDQPTTRTPPTMSKFGRRIVKAVTYRVKYVPTSGKTDPQEPSNREVEVGAASERFSTVSLGKSPSYKDVAVAPPGTISNLEAGLCGDDTESAVGKHESVIENDRDEKDVPTGKQVVEDAKEMNECAASETKDHMTAEMDDSKKFEENQSDGLASVQDDNSSVTPGAVKLLESIGIHVVTRESEQVNDNTSLNSPEALHVSAIEEEQGEKSDHHKPENQSDGLASVQDDNSSVTPGAVKLLELIGIHVVTRESEQVNDNPSLNSPEAIHVSAIEEEQGEKSDHHKPETSTYSALQGVEHPDDQALLISVHDIKDGVTKKLSASAAPFCPSPRVAPLAMNINIPSSPVAMRSAGPWPLSMSLHPGPATLVPTINPLSSSPHHAYPSPPTTPNLIQPVRFMYPPPYTQAQVITTNAFPASANYFHRGNYIWRLNVNPVTTQFIPTTVWPGSHPVEFPVMSPMADSTHDPLVEPKLQPLTEIEPITAPHLPDDVHKSMEVEHNVILPASESTEDIGKSDSLRLENEEGQAHSISSAEVDKGTPIVNDNLKENLTSSVFENAADQHSDDSEKTFTVLIRGRRNRKQRLRVPLSLLRRPYGSELFKTSYSRVVKEGETTSYASSPSTGDSSAA